MIDLRFWLYVGRRLLALVPQLLAVSIFTFALIRMLPGNPADLILGPARTQAGVEALSQEMGLDKPLHVQYWLYLNDVLQGDLGRSWFSSERVLDELLRRAPATLELVISALLVALTIGVAAGSFVALRPRNPATKILSWYIRFAGSFPDFFIGLAAVYIFFFVLGWAPPPMGRMGVGLESPARFTGFLIVDTILAGRFDHLVTALRHLALPVLTLGLIIGPGVGKVMRATILEVLSQDFIRYARAIGLPTRTVTWYAVRNALPPVVTLAGILFGYLLGGAVLMEKVFAWGGVGQYAVQAVGNSDHAAIQGFVLVAAAFTMFVYLLVDIVHMAIDPRVSHY